MPPSKRKAATASSSKVGGPRQSKLAKENNITAQEEAEIKEAFSLFAEPMDGEKEGVIPIGDVRRAMIALGIPPKSNSELREFTSILDPEDEGFATYPSFLAICAIKLSSRDRTSEAHMREVDEAFALFVGRSAQEIARLHDDHNDVDDDYGQYEEEEVDGKEEQEPVITLAHLKRVAAVLKENVSEELLRDMILEANGGAGVGKGVRREEFDGVMRRAGVWRLDDSFPVSCGIREREDSGDWELGTGANQQLLRHDPSLHANRSRATGLKTWAGRLAGLECHIPYLELFRRPQGKRLDGDPVVLLACLQSRHGIIRPRVLKSRPTNRAKGKTLEPSEGSRGLRVDGISWTKACLL
ncbi:uncharacterized protein B0T23DRAFT_434330 [Neurospora hispaniola]|uniref:Calmodulin n=1 Tax=Neurospora hispaniola TaxID=588809 RepID=A0AAJ0IFB4_9PEZI|nr:hypothetical protein B0T23DRAFT_434330 [Neurospora hispaniola]